MTAAAETTILSVTLSRAHKIADRIKAGMTERTTKAKSGTVGRNVVSSQVAYQAPLMVQAGKKALADLEDAQRWAAALVAVRQSISEANAPRVSSRLALLDSANRMLAVHQEILDNQSDTARPAATAAETPVPAFASHDPYVELRPLSEEDLIGLRAKVAELQRKVFTLSDELAEANAVRVSLELPSDIAAHVGG